MQSNDFFFCDVHSLCNVTSVSEVIVIFFQLILLANTAAFFCSLLGLVSHSFRECDSGEKISTGWLRLEKINYLHDSYSLFQDTMAYKPPFHAYSTIPDSFFHACSAIVDSFVITFVFS